MEPEPLVKRLLRPEVTSWVYLTVSVNNALYTVNAYVPSRPKAGNLPGRVLFLPSFAASLVTIELAWAHLVFQILQTLVFARLGALTRRPAKVALVLNVASWVALGLTIRHSLAAAHEVRDALKSLNHPRRAPRRLPVRVERNVEYQRVAGKRLRLDVFRPVDPPAEGERRPAIVQVHGGGWTVGDKREQGVLLLRHLASEGWVGFNVNYRLSPGATFPDHLVDVKRAIAWVREHADDYGVDPGFVAVTGGSAGGHLTALAALTANESELQPGFEDADTRVQAAVPFYGVYDFTNRNKTWPDEVLSQFLEPIVMKAYLADEPERFAAASPMDWVDHHDAPPFLVLHGDRDTLAPVEDARDFVDRLRAASPEPVYYLELHGAQHAFDIFPSIRSRRVIEAVGHFLDGVHTAYLREGGVLVPETVEEAVGAEIDTDALERPTGEPLQV
ncbi:MAG: alpha/beta hydrolase [Acidimicrobiales bacterium]